MGILERPRLSRDEDTHRTEQLSRVRITHRQGNSQDAGIDTEQGTSQYKEILTWDNGCPRTGDIHRTGQDPLMT
jgi:hypothetical protein